MYTKTATDKLIGLLSISSSSKEDINAAIQDYFNWVNNAEETDVVLSMERIMELIYIPDIENASLASLICGNLVEKGYKAEYIVDKFIGFYGELLQKSRPFFVELFSRLKAISSEEKDYDEKVNNIYQALIEEIREENYPTVDAIARLNKFYLCGVSLFSSDRFCFYKGKRVLEEQVNFIGAYNNGCYWLGTLFSVLFDEPVVVIDIDRKIGFEGEISGIVDNYQLQHLLMAMPLLNENNELTEEDISIIKGYGAQSSEKTVVSKWNIYNLELCSQQDWESLINGSDVKKSIEYKSCWIWSEGKPADISIHNGYRVILLGAPPYSRSARIQRTFRNLKADIKVNKILKAEEVEKWLGKQNGNSSTD